MTKSLNIAALLTLGLTVSAAAQHAARAPMSHPRTAATTRQPETRGAESAERTKSFNGIATKLGTTGTALQQAYDAAKAANPKLTRGQFIAANVLAHNLGEKNPAITTQAILDGLKSGKSIGQTLQGLGLSEKDATDAEHAADKDVKDAAKTQQ
jgi:hypothetical protein